MLKLEEYYQDVILLAEGGMSKVYLATDKKLGRRVAVKVMSLTQHTQSDALNEARLLARFNHPNIVQIYDVFESDGQMALEMEYVQGATLQHYTKTHVLTTEQKVELLSHIADGLASAHGQNILHLDLKPGNILVNEQSIAKIADFGISQLEDNQASRPHTSYGSLTAMSPEQLRDETLDSRSDLFSFGLIAYQLLAGHHPYFEQADDGSDKSIAEQIKFQPLKASAKRILDIPPALAQLIDRLLQYDKSARPSSANEVSQQLKQILHAFSYDNSEATVSLEQIELRDRAREKAKARQKQLSIAALFTVLVCLVVGGYCYWQETKPKIYIAALPIKFTNSFQLLEAHQQNIELAINDALKQHFLSNNDYVFISDREVDQTQKFIGVDAPLKALGRALNSNELVTIKLDCNIQSCDIVIDLVDASNGALINSARTMTSSENYSHVFAITASALTALTGRSTDLATGNKTLLNNYATLHDASLVKGADRAAILKELTTLIDTAPDFLPLYSLYSELAIQLYEDSSNDQVLLNWEQVLQQAPKRLKASTIIQTSYLEFYAFAKDKIRATGTFLAIQNSVKDEYQKHALISIYYHLINDYASALHHIELAYELRPTLKVIRNAALLNMKLGQYEEALPYLRAASHYGPDNLKTLKAIADISLLLGKLHDAEKSYQALVNRSYTSTATFNNYAIVLMLLGDLERALEFAERATQLAPSNVEILLNYADIYSLMGEKAKASEVYLQILASAPANQVEVVRIQALAHLGRHQEALIAIDEYLAEYPDSAEAFYVKSLIQTLIEEKYSAMASLKKSIDLGWSPSFYRLSWFKTLCHSPSLELRIGTEHFTYLCQVQIMN
ncbi:protein kinase domain-containing protein [Pseudoalteromonas piscicida]|uniref:protein kinase domain-containing protein n=1 Tax=Pseudoalteromonas piscicida TaxID=43662 RepID=UPI0027E41A04|nr:protein kinase [Pseudoalteromonas piscicida]WMO15523.1 protein kinase [Pseudoalteromonas piscicida]